MTDTLPLDHDDADPDDTADPVALLEHLTRTNYQRAATAPADTAHGYERIADVLAAAHPDTWTAHTRALPSAEVADQIAASLFIRLRDIPTEAPEYRELDGIRVHFHQLRRTALGWPAPGPSPTAGRTEGER